MPEGKAVNWVKIGLIVQFVLGLVLIFVLIYKPAKMSQPDYTYVKQLEIPTKEWFSQFGFSDESQFVFNIFMNRRVLTSHYKKIMEIDQRLKALEKAFEGKSIEEAIATVDKSKGTIEDPNK